MSCSVTLGLLNESSETGCPHRVALQHFPEILPSRREADQEDAANFFSDFVLKKGFRDLSLVLIEVGPYKHESPIGVRH